MSGSKSRGLGARWCIIDDPVDVFHPTEIHGLTKKIYRWLKQKILPIMKGGSIAFVGTRYDIKDIYILLAESKIWKIIRRKAIIKWGEYTIPGTNYKASDIKYTGDWELLAPKLFENLPTDPEADAIQNILFMLEDMGNKEFSQELQNDPVPLNPAIQWEWFRIVDKLPTRPEAMRWVAFVDPAVSEKDGDYTAMTLVGYWNKQFYLYDILHGRFSMLKKIEMIESTLLGWEQVLNVNIRLYIETLMNQQECYQTIRDRDNNITPIKINPKERGSKEFRITANISFAAEKGEVFIFEKCRKLHILEQEVNGFPHAEHDDVIDSFDQAHYQLKRQVKSFQYAM